MQSSIVVSRHFRPELSSMWHFLTITAITSHASIRQPAKSESTPVRRITVHDAGRTPGGGRYRSIAGERRRRGAVNKLHVAAAYWLSICGTDGRTDGRTPDRYIDAYCAVCWPLVTFLVVSVNSSFLHPYFMLVLINGTKMFGQNQSIQWLQFHWKIVFVLDDVWIRKHCKLSSTVNAAARRPCLMGQSPHTAASVYSRYYQSISLC